MPASVPLKSILKKPLPSTNNNTTVAVPTKEERDRETALYHANLIQARKDIELEILFSIEKLVDFPLTRGLPFTSASPAPSDVSEFKNLLRPFQSSDYDDLIQERNIVESCGYTLCPKKRVTGQHRVRGTGKGTDFRVASKEELDKWCSDGCARRALYVKVQLSERPAWERGAATGAPIELLDEPKTEQETREALLLEDIRKLELGASEKKEEGMRNLALERGDSGRAAATGLVEIKIQEKETTKQAQAPSFDVHDLDDQMGNMHLQMEGYLPKFTERRTPDLRREISDDKMDGSTPPSSLSSKFIDNRRPRTNHEYSDGPEDDYFDEDGEGDTGMDWLE